MGLIAIGRLPLVNERYLTAVDVGQGAFHAVT